MSYRRRYRRSYSYYDTPNRSSNTLAAHPTYYNGREFKSKMEVRWAYLFDTLRVPWQYEEHRFYAGGGGYIPDFYLPSLGVWWEVKGAQPNPAACRAAHSLMMQTQRPVCLSWGSMAPGENGHVWCMIDADRAEYVGLAGCAICSELRVVALAARPHDKHLYQFHHPDVSAAFDAAKGLRFERGAA